MTIIEKLKDPAQAQPFGLRSPEEQKVLRKADTQNHLYFDTHGRWLECPNTNYWPDRTFILKPDYEPKPEYVDNVVAMLPTTNKSNRLQVCVPGFGNCTINVAPSFPNFVKFWLESDNFKVGRSIEVIACCVHDGKKVYARFRTD